MDRVQAGRVLGPVAVAAGVPALLAILDVVTGLGPLGWGAGLVSGAGLVVLLDGALVRHRRSDLGPAGRVTATRAALACGVAALTAESYVADSPVTLVVALATVGLLLDAVDGWVARRTASESAFGGRFDMEVDAFLIAVLSAYVAPTAGWWVLAIGALRYGYVAASWVLTWLRRPLPPRYSAKVVAALQGIVLTVAASALLPLVVIRLALLISLLLLVDSFARDVRKLWRERVEPLPPLPDARFGPGALVRPGVVTGAAFVGLWVALALPDPGVGSRAGGPAADPGRRCGPGRARPGAAVAAAALGGRRVRRGRRSPARAPHRQRRVRPGAGPPVRPAR